MSNNLTIGLIVNPVAGIGGRAGLKGSDSREIQRLAIQLGAEPEAPSRAVEALKVLLGACPDVKVITPPGQMGAEECRCARVMLQELPMNTSNPTTPKDTETAAGELVRQGISLLLFAGGDGTARDIFRAVQSTVPVIGIPAGVKIHSAVFAKNPSQAGCLAARFLKGDVVRCREREVMDIDEDAYRQGRVTAKLYGYMSVPFAEGMVQKLKAGSISEASALHAIASDVVERMEEDTYYIVGAGTTTRCITDLLGLSKTLLGVDVVYRKQILARDLSERKLLQLLQGKKAKIIITPIGGQGYLFGRGNQQLSAQVLRMVGHDNIWVIATNQKIADLEGMPFFVDTGDRELNRQFSGYVRVIVGYRQELVYPVTC